MIQFGTGGWRAIIGDEFRKDNVQLLAAAVARLVTQENVQDKGLILGYDRRFLSEEAVKWVAEVLAAAGVKCQLVRGQSPTPLIMYAIEKSGVPYGMAITASHNPAIYNGIKVFMQGGRDADEQLTARIEAHIAALEGQSIPTLPYGEALASGRVALINPMNEYIDSILATVDAKAIRDRELRVALDPMFGVARTAFQTVLYTLRCGVQTINERRDALFGGRMPAPSQQTLAGLVTFVQENHFDIGIATDGDGDRLGVVNDKAEYLHFNKILVLLYYYLLQYKGWKGPVVRNIATTSLLDRVAAAFGEECYEVPVGFKHISSKMAQTGAILGGESSGGLTVKGHIKGKDGIYAGTLLIEMLAISGRSLSDLWQEIEDRFGRFEMVERDHHFSTQKKQEIYTRLMVDRQLPDFGIEVAGVNYMDGCKVHFKNGGWVIARFSGTEPLLRIFCEMGSEAEALQTAALLEGFLGLAR